MLWWFGVLNDGRRRWLLVVVVMTHWRWLLWMMVVVEKEIVCLLTMLEVAMMPQLT